MLTTAARVRHHPVLAGPAPVLLLVAVAAVAAALRSEFTDLLVYQHAGRAVLDGLSLYEVDEPVTGCRSPTRRSRRY